MESKPEEPKSPYPGLQPFQQTESGLFYGREKETHQVVNLILAHSVVVLYSKSGLGKTSLLNAGVIPRLTDEGLEVLPHARGAGLSIEHDGFGDARNICGFGAISSSVRDRTDCRQLTRSTLVRYLTERPRVLNDIGRPSARVVIFDQFEELFTAYPSRREDRQDFFAQVRDALERDPLLRIVLSLREEYLGEIDQYLSVLGGKLQARFRLEGLRREEALRIVTGPFLAAGRTLMPGVAERLVHGLTRIRSSTADGRPIEGSGEFIEPVLLQEVCRSLWMDLPPDLRVVALADVEAFGVLGEKLSTMYEMSVTRATQETGVREKDIRAWFSRDLITPAQTRGSLCRGPRETGGIPNSVIDVLERLHIVRAEWRMGARWYELTHDVLIEPILQSNKSWWRQQGTRGF